MRSSSSSGWVYVESVGRGCQPTLEALGQTERLYLARGDADEGRGPTALFLFHHCSEAVRRRKYLEAWQSPSFLCDLHSDRPSSGPAVSGKVLCIRLNRLPPAIHGHGQTLHVEYVCLHLMKGNRADLIHVEGGDLMPTSLIFDFRGKHFFGKATHRIIDF